MNYLILIAEKEEIKILEKLPPFFTQLPILITGVGANNVIHALNRISPNTHLINIGYAGAKNINIGTVVEIKQAKLHHPSISYNEPDLQLLPLSSINPQWQNLFPTSVCYSCTDFVISSPFNECVFDMELAFIASLNFPTSALKLVSDNLSYEQYKQSINQ